MKNYLLLISAFFIIGIAQAQYYNYWTEPVAITDSISLNSNPAVLIFYNEGNNDIFCFYEKRSSESSPSQIWYRNIYSMMDEQVFLSDDIFKFRNPKILTYPPNYNSRYFLFYESNETGDFEIYGIEVFIDGTFGPSFQMTANEVDNSSFFVTHDDNSEIAACWKSGNSIQFSNILFSGDTLLFEEIYTVDTTNSYDPVCLLDLGYGVNSFVSYRKIINDSSQIYFSEFDEVENNWSEPDTIYATGNNINLSSVGYSYGFPSENLCWENNGKIMFYDHWQNQTETMETWVPGNYEPSYITSMFGCKVGYPVIFTFCSGEGNNRKIYSLGEWGEVQTITDNNYFESNPKIFYERFYYNYFNAVNIWETHKNDKLVLYMSRKSFDLTGSIEDNKSGTNRFIKASPNPFKNGLKVDYFLSSNEKASIDIYSITGKQIHHIDIKNQTDAWNSYTWKLDETQQANLPIGVYLIVLKQGKETAMQKVIYSK